MPRELVVDKRARAKRIVATLNAAYPHSTCALDHDSPFQLLVATMMSAQTTDVKVNEATAELFARWPTPQALAQADVDEVGATINSIGLWRNKAKNAVALSQMLVTEFDGEMPLTVDELTRLPGVGRKTATATLGTAFDMEVGVTVDTHMLRINKLLKLSTKTDPDKMAAELERLLPPADWNHYTHLIIDHGRLVCVARRPRCGVCPLAADCPSAFDAKAGYKPAHDEKVPASAKGLSWRSRLR
ncbi:MAG: endonuclease III [Thermoplasmatota archaeon]